MMKKFTLNQKMKIVQFYFENDRSILELKEHIKSMFLTAPIENDCTQHHCSFSILLSLTFGLGIQYILTSCSCGSYKRCKGLP